MVRKNVLSVIVTVPSASQPGGVSQLFQILREHLGDHVDYFEVGSRSEAVGFMQVLIRSVKDYGRFTRKLLVERHDVVHINPSMLPKAIVRDGIFLLLSKLLGRCVVVFFHGWDASFEQTLRKYFLGIFRWTYFRADAVLVLANEFSTRLVSMGYKGRLHVGSTAIDDGMLLGDVPALYATKYSRGRGKFNILFLSRIVKKKGVFEAVDAYWHLRKRYPTATLTIAGEGPDLESVKTYVHDRSIPDVFFAGFVTGQAKAEAFGEADAYLFPSYSEGMPLSVLEAMASGLPVVTRPVGALRDFFEDKRMGFIIESLAPGDIADALERLLTNRELCLSVGKYNYEYAKKHFSAKNAARALIRHYEEVMA
ncbi:MAG: glycosyltransferase family 4 protein [Nitrospira sp.]|nr:glycosyltransferase family 4 protein [Nitrospira sp.]